MKSAVNFLQLAAVAVWAAFATPAFAVTDVNWWHAMSGELGRQVDKLGRAGELRARLRRND